MTVDIYAGAVEEGGSLWIVSVLLHAHEGLECKRCFFCFEVVLCNAIAVLVHHTNTARETSHKARMNANG
jgi:hypothetical protein